MFKYTNKANVSLPLAVFLAYDTYDYDSRSTIISATTLIKPIKQIVLARQNKHLTKEVDILDLVSARMGSAIHDACERAWSSPEHLASVAEAFGINTDYLQVSAEQRHEKEINGFIISGKYDLVLNGNLHDYKSTSVWSYIYDSNATQYSLQGSIYRWLAPEIITGDVLAIQYIFTDWSSSKARADTSYPQTRVATRNYPLKSVSATEAYIRGKTAQINELMQSPQEVLPDCSDEELWASEAIWKYYKVPGATRSTKNYSNEADAYAHQTREGCGEVVHVPGQVKACEYCAVVNICNQAKQLRDEGRLLL